MDCKGIRSFSILCLLNILQLLSPSQGPPTAWNDALVHLGARLGVLASRTDWTNWLRWITYLLNQISPTVSERAQILPVANKPLMPLMCFLCLWLGGGEEPRSPAAGIFCRFLRSSTLESGVSLQARAQWTKRSQLSWSPSLAWYWTW